MGQEREASETRSKTFRVASNGPRRSEKGEVMKTTITTTVTRGHGLQAAMPLPCPFCGATGITIREGSTFRWLLGECNGCGATCGEVRVQTCGEGIPADWRKHGEDAVIAEWNKRPNVEFSGTPAALSPEAPLQRLVGPHGDGNV